MIVRWKEIWLTIIVACTYRMILARTQFNLERLRLISQIRDGLKSIDAVLKRVSAIRC